MENRLAKVLLVEDNPLDVRLLKEALVDSKTADFDLVHVDRLEHALKRLGDGGIDLVLLDLSLPDSQGLATATKVREAFPNVPLVVLTGLDDEFMAVRALQEGAQDYVAKGQISNGLLVRSLRYAYERSRILTELEQRRLEIQAREENFRNVITTNLDAIVIVDQRGIVRFVNPAGEALFNRRADEFVNKPFGYPVPLGEVTEIEISQGCARPSVAEMRVVEIDWEGEEAYLASLRDVTEQKRIQERLRETSQLVAVGELAAGVAHELNNPLTAVLGFAQLVMKRELPDGVAQDVEKIYSEAQRAAKIVHNLLSFARRHEPEKRCVNIRDILDLTLNLRAYDLNVNNIEVKTHYDPELPSLMADEHQLVQVFLNIVTNAEQAMRDIAGGGALTVEARKVGDKVQVSFADDGPGIPAEYLSRVFDPFFTTKEVGKGTGLGLSMCYGMVRAHDGEIWAESVEGEGSIIYIELPVTECIAEKSEPMEYKPPHVKGKRILVIDDEFLITDLLSKALPKTGYAVDVTGDGEEAWHAIVKKPYDCIVMDLKMPGINGRQLYKRVESWDKSVAKKVVFITGDTLSPDTREFLEATGNYWVGKPFTLDEMDRRIRACMTKRE